MHREIQSTQRTSYMEIGKLYFWTATINGWKRLLQPDEVKQIIIDSLKYLSNHRKIEVYGFVIMPNHVHFIWRMLEINGKEMPQGSFLKFTAHAFKKYLLTYAPQHLADYAVETHNKQYEFWQRDPMAIELYSYPVAIQKLVYLHNNAFAEHWQLCRYPTDYHYSSAAFYEEDGNDFEILHRLDDYFYG